MDMCYELKITVCDQKIYNSILQQIFRLIYVIILVTVAITTEKKVLI